MNWPKKIPFGAVEIRHEFVHPDVLESCLGDYRIRNGHPWCRTDETLEGGLRDQTVVHELVHAWFRMSGITMEREVEETVCDAVANGVVQLLRAMPPQGGKK